MDAGSCRSARARDRVVPFNSSVTDTPQSRASALLQDMFLQDAIQELTHERITQHCKV
jgi:hypothetical protein